MIAHSTDSVSPRSASELVEIVRTTQGPLRIVAGGAWLDAGHPVISATRVQLSEFSGVRSYVPADLTISVGAATTLAELDAVTREHGQWCPMLPWGNDVGTVGATIATATAGPLAPALGRPRDLVIGLECVDGHGRLIRAGGRVVKNVAGFDLTRLMTGAWGTLGVITEVHLRLRARPLIDETVIVRGNRANTATAANAPNGANAANAANAMAAYLRGPYAPLGFVALTPRLAASLGVGVEPGWIVRFGGNAAFAAAARAALARVGTCEAAPPDAWDIVRATSAPATVTTRWHWNSLARQLKERFDPRDVLNRGLLGDHTRSAT